MSPRSTDNPRRPSSSAAGQTYHSEHDHLDRRLKHLREEVLPFYPFLLTVPTDVPFRLGHRFVNNWAVGDDGPFAPDEHQLQYMTFLAHDEGDSLLVAVGDWSDGTGSVMADPRSRHQSATSTPPNGSMKKKISLNDYKNKRRNGTSPSPLSQETCGHHSRSTLQAPYDHHTRSPKPTLTSDSCIKLPKKNPAPDPLPQSESGDLGRKRPPERDDGRHCQGKGGAQSKRQRLSPEPATCHNKMESSTSNRIPELLSPTLPPTSTTSDTPRIPRLLSPTLPPDLERELAKLGNEPITSDSQPESTINSDVARPKPQKDRLFTRGTLQLESSSTSTSHQKSPGQQPGLELGKYVLKSAGPAKLSSHVAAPAKINLQPQTDSRPALPSNAKPADSSLSRPRLVVRLKYGRSNRKRVEGLLKFSGKRKLSHQSPPAIDIAEQEPSHPIKPEHLRVSVSDQFNKTTHADGGAKLVTRTDAISSTKDRPKEPRPAVSEKPQTPILNQTQQDKSRQVSITPTKELKHSSPRQDLTTSGGKGNSSTVARNMPTEKPSGENKQSPPQPKSVERNGERRAWKEEYHKYGNLGRELKHAADHHTAKDRVTSTDEKLAAVTAIEAILCFVLAFIADDQSKIASRHVGDSATWLSIIAYWRVVKKNSSPYPPLYSICLILGAVSYDAIHALDLERLAAMVLPGEHTPVPTPATDGHSVNSDDGKKSLKDFLELKNRLLEFYKESQRLWSDGSRGLSEDILAREFPDTWSRRSKNYSEQGRKRLKPGDYSGEIYLPLGKSSTPLEIIRFCCALLREWCSKEKIDWRGKLDL
ncbi:hypothetical protein BJX61DRAFT_205871 [Aspergillus egyptiacus]|nr:hypothetical protein BJX61DRAFT_205871 [Aspergillus egyptiacus]